jgi:B-cell receptor-associated protein 31
MLQLLFALLSIELIVILTLSFANPIRKLMVKVLDLLKRGRGPLITKTVATTVFLVFGSTMYTILKIYKRSMDVGMVNPTEEVLMAHHLLEASLMGNLL